MSLPNCFVLGCARNCGKHIPAVFENIKKLGEVFANIHVVIAFDYSTDDTLQQLTTQQSTFPYTIDILTNNEALSPIRTQRICNARNKLLDHMNTLHSQQWEYFIMIDLDDVCASSIRIDVLKQWLQQPEKWDALSFNKREYYDIWALSYSPYVVSCWNWGDQATCVNVVHFMMSDFQKRLEKLDKDELYPVNSAFNGFAVYKYSKFVGCRYDWHTMDVGNLPRDDLIHCISHFQLFPTYRACYDDCEHREFHRQGIAKHDAKIMVTKDILFP